MYRYTILIISFLLVILFYTIPAYSGVNTGCCQLGRYCQNQDDGGASCTGGGSPVWYSGWSCPVQGTPSTCEAPTGACCLPTNECLDEVEESACLAEGGLFQGGESLCSEVDCPVNPDHLMCYQVKDPLKLPREKDPKTIFVSVPQFGSEARCQLKGATRLFCAPACKAKQGDPPVGGGLCQPDADNPLGFDRVCYNVENCGEISGQIDELAVGVTDQFDDISISTEGPRLFTNFNPHQICTPALKCAKDCPVQKFEVYDPCDTNQTRDNEYCDMNCQCVMPECGNGIIEPGEECEISDDCFGGDDIGPTRGPVCNECICENP